MIRTPAGWWGDYSDDEAADFPGLDIVLALPDRTIARGACRSYSGIGQPEWQYPDEFFFAIRRMRATGSTTGTWTPLREATAPVC